MSDQELPTSLCQLKLNCAIGVMLDMNIPLSNKLVGVVLRTGHAEIEPLGKLMRCLRLVAVPRQMLQKRYRDLIQTHDYLRVIVLLLRLRRLKRRHMKAHAYLNATSADLWNSLSQASGRDIAAIAADWTEQPGFPLVSVASHCDAQGVRTIELSQHRFMQSGPSGEASAWHIPLRVRSGARAAATSLLLSKGEQHLAAGRCDELPVPLF